MSVASWRSGIVVLVGTIGLIGLPGRALWAQCAEAPPAPDPCQRLRQAIAAAYQPLFYNNDFGYLLNPRYDAWWPGDAFKRRTLGPACVDVGGQYRLRFHDEQNHRGLGLTGQDDDFLLQRLRLFANVEVSDGLRFYAEMIDAQSSFESFTPRPVEENRADLLNLFADVKLSATPAGQFWARVGRQELLYGSQRLISPLDWSNTRRTFEGAKLWWKGDDWSWDVFWTRPVVVSPNRFDQADYSQQFTGTYGVFSGCENRTLEFYYLHYTEEDQTPFQFDTWGSRWTGTEGDWSWEFEGGVQTGDFNNLDHLAGFWTAGIGRSYQNLPWKPSVWVYYDWASGDETIGNGFHHLFPLGHRYLGYIDFFGRRNLEDTNVLLTLNPRQNIQLGLWYHLFYLQDGDDVPYNVNMAPFVTTVGGDQHLGHELDVTASWDLNARMNVLLGYSHFFAGDYYRTNPAAPYSGDAMFFYSQFTVNF